MRISFLYMCPFCSGSNEYLFISMFGRYSVVAELEALESGRLCCSPICD